jgi:hypothetical protein
MELSMAARKKAVPHSTVAPVLPAKRVTMENPLVFISHDSRDADLAEAFGNLLTDASGGILKSFRSSDRKGTAGIEYGQEWYRAIMQKLDDATDVVALLTTHSVNRPWILYEAGVAKGKLSANDRVLGIALGVSLDEAATGPFAQFQNSPDEEGAITGLVLQLIRRHPQAAPREEAVQLQVQAFRKAVAALLTNRRTEPPQQATRADETSAAKFFEEIKILVRDMSDRVSSELGADPRVRRLRGGRRFHPAMLEELIHHPMFRESLDRTGVPVLILFSMLRDDYPWLYELGLHLYHAIESGNAKATQRERKIIVSSIEMVLHRGGPFAEMLGGRDEESMMLLHHIARSIDRLIPMPMRPVKGEAKSAEKGE